MKKELDPMLKSLDNLNLTLINKNILKLALEMAFILGENSQSKYFNEKNSEELISRDREQMISYIFGKLDIPYPKQHEKLSD